MTSPLSKRGLGSGQSDGRDAGYIHLVEQKYKHQNASRLEAKPLWNALFIQYSLPEG